MIRLRYLIAAVPSTTLIHCVLNLDNKVPEKHTHPLHAPTLENNVFAKYFIEANASENRAQRLLGLLIEHNERTDIAWSIGPNRSNHTLPDRYPHRTIVVCIPITKQLPKDHTLFWNVQSPPIHAASFSRFLSLTAEHTTLIEQ